MLPAAGCLGSRPALPSSFCAPPCALSTSRAHLTIGAMRRTISRRGAALSPCVGPASTPTAAARRRQGVNEELNWGTSNVSCCISNTNRAATLSPCDVGKLGVFFAKDSNTHDLKNKRTADVECAASGALPPAMPAPKKSPQKWTNYGGHGGWRSDEFNERTGSTIGRCSRTDNRCGGCGDNLWAAPMAARSTAAIVSSLAAASNQAT